MSWQLDPYHTQVEFAVKHLGMMTVRGHFSDVTSSGNIDPENPVNSAFEVTIAVGSIKTHNEQRDNDLRGSYFLELDKYPTMTFKSTSITPAGDDQYKLTGDLTIKGNTRPVTLDVVRYGEFNDPGMMGHRIAYSAEGKIKRHDFGMTNSMLLDGRLVVGEDVNISIEVEVVERQPASAEQPASTASA